MKKIVIFEGLPLVGKTTLVNHIRDLNINNVHCVDELILSTQELNQDSFMQNDLAKANKYQDGLIFIDKLFISTLSYNEMLHYLGHNNDLDKVRDWFNREAVPFYQNRDVETIYLKSNKMGLRENNPLSPHGSIKNQIKMEGIVLQNIKKYCKNYIIVNYSQENMREFANEIITKHL